MKETKIDGRIVPIKPGPKTTITFSAGAGGAEEAGEWEFWTAVRGRVRNTVRCRKGKDPGERFRRMEGAPGYERSWEMARNAEYLWPASATKLESWLNDHPDDARYIESGEVGGKKVRVVNEGGHYRVVTGAS